jgi:hypothetical protein
MLRATLWPRAVRATEEALERAALEAVMLLQKKQGKIDQSR